MIAQYFWEEDRLRGDIRPLIQEKCLRSIHEIIKYPLEINHTLPVYIRKIDPASQNIFYCDFLGKRILTPDVFTLQYNIWKFNHRYGQDDWVFFEFKQFIHHKDKWYVGFLHTL